MVAERQVKSIRRPYMWLMSFFVTAVFAALYFSYIFIILKPQEEALKQDITQRAKVITNNAVSYIVENNFNDYQASISKLSVVSRYNYVHIYNIQNGELDFFSSFNKVGFSPMADKISEIERYLQPIITDNIIELTYPIKNNNDTIGYAYLQLNADTFADSKTTALITFIIGYILAIGFGIFVILKLHQRLSSQLGELVVTTMDISKKRNYQLRYQEMDTLEFAHLAKSLNVMLGRTEKFIQKQDNAEQEILKLNHELEYKVNQRTEALKESNQELLSTLEKLHQFQGQLVESEKMASLGDMVAGVAHEVNTPIGLGVTASTLMSDRLKEIKEAFENKTLKSSQLKKFLAEGEENVGIIYRNLNRAADLISSFKKVAVDQSSEEDRSFKVLELIDEVILSLAPQLKQKTIDLQVDCPSNLQIISKPGPINQILINLIVNSIIHGFEHKSEGIININIMMLSGQLHINYKDNGKGVDKVVKNKIFDPFITTKRGEGGSGLGLHLVYNLVTQALNGNINFDSEVGHGVQFDINFPVQLDD